MTLEQVCGLTDQHITWLSSSIGLHKEVIAPWQALYQAAEKDGFELTIASGFRSFERQLSIWNRKFSGELAIKTIDNQTLDITGCSDEEIVDAILTFSALPGTSRHHWGTDLDVYSKAMLAEGESLKLEPWEYQEGGPFFQHHNWLNLNAKRYGFYFPYDKYRGGVAHEPWHLSYFPLAKGYQQQLNKEVLIQCLSEHDILGKASIITQLDELLSQYVFNIGLPPNE